MILCGSHNLNMGKNIVLFRAVHRYTVYMILNVFNQLTLCLKFFLKHILYVDKFYLHLFNKLFIYLFIYSFIYVIN